MYAFGTMLDEPYVLTLEELRASATKWGAAGKAGNGSSSTHVPGNAAYVTYDHVRGPGSARLWPSSSERTSERTLEQTSEQPSSSNSLHFKSGFDYGALTYHVVAPVLSNGWAVLGETAKFVPMSEQRVRSVVVKEHGVVLHVVGMPGETVTVSALEPGGTTPSQHSAVIDADGKAVISMKPAASVVPRLTPQAPVNLSSAFVPPPHHFTQHTSLPAANVGPDWIIATDLSNEQNVFAANDLAAALFEITGGTHSYPVLDSRALATEPPAQPAKFIAFGTGAEDVVVTTQLALRNMSLSKLGR